MIRNMSNCFKDNNINSLVGDESSLTYVLMFRFRSIFIPRYIMVGTLSWLRHDQIKIGSDRHVRAVQIMLMRRNVMDRKK